MKTKQSEGWGFRYLKRIPSHQILLKTTERSDLFKPFFFEGPAPPFPLSISPARRIKFKISATIACVKPLWGTPKRSDSSYWKSSFLSFFSLFFQSSALLSQLLQFDSKQRGTAPKREKKTKIKPLRSKTNRTDSDLTDGAQKNRFFPNRNLARFSVLFLSTSSFTSAPRQLTKKGLLRASE